MLVLKDLSGNPLDHPPAPITAIYGKTAYIEVNDSYFPPYWRHWVLEYRWSTNSGFIGGEAWTLLTAVPRPSTTYSHTLPNFETDVYVQYRYKLVSATGFTVWSSEGNANTLEDGIPETGGGELDKYTTDIGDGTATTFNITHNLSTLDVIIDVYSNASPYEGIEPTKKRVDSNTAQLVFSKPPSTGEFRVVVIG